MPADPSEPSRAEERDPYEADEAEEAEAAASEAGTDVANLPALLALAKAYRSGNAPGGRDMKKCLESYRAAAELGSAEAEYAVALFSMNGGTVVAQDLKVGTTSLRVAAEKGSVAAKVYLGNLYELGIHYKADPEKADVWYRNAARSAGVTAEAGSEEWLRAMAELGCARYVLILTSKSEDEAEKKRLLARAKAHGHGLRIRSDPGEGDRATFVDALAGAEAAHGGGAGPAGAMTGTPPPVAVDVPQRERKDTSPETRQAKAKVEERSKSQPPPAKTLTAAERASLEKADRAAKKAAAERSARIAGALAAFGYALLFMLAGASAGYAAALGARELVAHGQSLPGLGKNTRYVFPIVVGVIGVLPAWLVYRFSAFLKGLLGGAVVGAIGWVAWGTGRAVFHSDRQVQAFVFGLVGFLVAMLVLGLLGGTKQARPLPRAR